jgi:hypothetical protein
MYDGQYVFKQGWMFNNVNQYYKWIFLFKWAVNLKMNMNFKIKIKWIASFQFNHLNWKFFDENILK